MSRYARTMSYYSPMTVSSPTHDDIRMPLSHESSFDIVFDRFNHNHLMEQLFKTRTGRDAFKRRKREVSDGIERKGLGAKSVREALFREQVRIRQCLAITDPAKTQDLQVHLHHYGFRRDWQLLMAITERLTSKPEPERRVRIGKERRLELERAWKYGTRIDHKPSSLRFELDSNPKQESSRLRKISVGLKLVINSPVDGPWSTETELLSPVDLLPDNAMPTIQTIHTIIPGQDVDETGERHVGAAEMGDLSNPNSPNLARTRPISVQPSPIKRQTLSSPRGHEVRLEKNAKQKFLKPSWSMSRVVGWFFATSK
jgi:hypothetical protein